MHRTAVVIVGAGQAGLAVSSLLTVASVDHVILERGRIAESWRSRRWDSLRLLTPNWLSRLPGFRYQGPDPAGFMSAGSVAGYLGQYAESFRAPVVAGAGVRSLRWADGAYRVESEAGSWAARSVVIATGHCDVPAVPGMSRRLDRDIHQFTPDDYRNPADVPDGGVLVIGASATGVQLADELNAAGREVVLAVGRHTRLSRRYRGFDIMWWLDSMGLLDRRVDPGETRRPEPSLQIVGDTGGREVDLGSLAGRGVDVTGRVAGLEGGMASLADDLALTTAAADTGLVRLLSRIDGFISASGLDSEVEEPTRPGPACPTGHHLLPRRLNLRDRGIRSVIWATGYHRRYPWLHLPVVNADGDIRHQAGRTAIPGLMVMGMRWQTRRSSTFLDGVRHDAKVVVDHLVDEVLAGPGTHRRVP